MMKTKAKYLGKISAKLLALVLIFVCLAIGAVGLILPIIPGLLFLAIAVLIVSSNFPSLRRWLRKNQTVREHLDRAEGFSGLTLLEKLQLGVLISIKVALDGIVYVGSYVASALKQAAQKYEAHK